MVGKTILFQGDSITDAGCVKEGQANKNLGQGYANMIAGRLGQQFAEAGHRYINKGISGNRVSDLYARWNEDAFFIKPDIISILIGVNDAWRIMYKLPTGATDRFERAYVHLLEETRDVLPETGLILCEPFILKAGVTEENWEEWRSCVDRYGQIVRRLSERFDAVFVPLQQPLDLAASRAEARFWLHDGVHPTAAGHALIADEWISAVQSSKLAIT